MANNQPQNGAFYQRHIVPAVRAALEDTPVVVIHGPRQSGKSTLVQSLISESFPARYVTFDDAIVLSAARAGPADFLAGFEGPLVIDEVHRAPGILLAIKAEVDRRRAPGRYLLTGSTHVRFIPEISEALVGRSEILTLWPLSQGEIEGRRESFLDAVFGDVVPKPRGEPVDRAAIVGRALTGGYPEAVRRHQPGRRRAWFASYVTTILQREVRDLADVAGLADLPRLLALAAARAGGIQNFSELSRSSAIPQTTLKRYLALLEAVFLVQTIPAWSGNLGKRLLKSPRLYPVDSGLMAYLLGLDREGLDAPGAPIGPLLETFVVGEIRKQLGWSKIQLEIHHLRSAAQEEVDIVLEDRRRSVVAIEVKASSAVDERDFRHLKRLREDLGKRFLRGIVLHPGREAVTFGPELHALPLTTLWRS